ncbi:MAG: 4Fe-4S dicluster domain-containing protein, partial [Actinomycetota bacterium]|nr:4Fe-4S dicluster domain-containing protein [Actinomycetota bacterium]
MTAALAFVLGAAEQTRETFAGLETWEVAIWYALILVSTAIFAWGIARLVLKYRKGRGAFGLDRPTLRLARTARVVFTHSWIRRRDPLAGLGHLLIFYGFLVLFTGTAILAFQDDVARPLLGFDFWRGWFYLGYSLFLDLFGAALVIGLAVFAVKRAVLKPFRLDYRRPDRREGEYDRRPYVIGDWLFLAILFFLALTGFLLEAFRIAVGDPSFEVWSPAGWALAQGFGAAGLGGEAADSARLATWWVHGVAALAFVSSIPFTKAVHMLLGPASVAVKDGRAGERLPQLAPGAKAAEVGYAFIDALSPKHLLDLDACTKCGKCHAACPATATGYPLSPRDVVLDLREVAEGSMGNRAALGIEPRFPDHAEILGTIKPETLWSCMQCMACVEICPVGIEHVPMIVQLRRRLVEEGEMDAQLQQTLETIYTAGNSFGEPKRKRARWARELDFDVKDIRKEPAELLWFVGDYASFDPRNQRATRALATVLREAGADYGILFDAERTGGCDVRRVGEEGLWRELAETNIETLNGCRFERIFSSDPHTFHTLRNDYPQLGGSWNVLH